jgi:ABC-type transport system involved in multi-copper enzyme maturation permease subunit
MVRLILIQRLQEDLLNHKVLVSILVSTVLLGASMGLSVADLRTRQEIYGRNVSLQPDLAPLFRPPEVLGTLVRGAQADVYGGKSVAGVNVERVPPPSYENPLLALFPTPDLRFIVQYILSLLALMMAFDLVAGLKERKTLALIFANPVERGRFLLGQCLGSYLGLAVAFLLGFLVSAALLVTSGAGAVSGDLALRMAGIAVVSLLYLAVSFLLGALFSTLAFDSSRAFLLALLTWVALVLVLPHLLLLGGSQLRRVRPIEVVAADKNAVRNDILGKEMAFLTEWPKANEAMEAIDGGYAHEVGAQEAVMKAAARVSPAGSYALAASALAGTSIDDAENYIGSVRSYLTRLRHWVYVEQPDNPDSERPVFFRERPSPGEAVASAAADAALLAAWGAGLAFLTFRRFQRYDVR